MHIHYLHMKFFGPLLLCTQLLLIGSKPNVLMIRATSSNLTFCIPKFLHIKQVAHNNPTCLCINQGSLGEKTRVNSRTGRRKLTQELSMLYGGRTKRGCAEIWLPPVVFTSWYHLDVLLHLYLIEEASIEEMQKQLYSWRGATQSRFCNQIWNHVLKKIGVNGRNWGLQAAANLIGELQITTTTLYFAFRFELRILISSLLDLRMTSPKYCNTNWSIPS